MIGQAYKNAQAAWGALPDWVAALAEECDRTSQGKAAKKQPPFVPIEKIAMLNLVARCSFTRTCVQPHVA